MARLSFFSAVFLAFATTNAQGVLQARNPYYGGFALPGTPEDGAVHGCPTGTLTCSNQVFTFCCPNFTFCGPFQLGPYCCPTSDDCGTVVNAGLTCADPSWTLYQDAFDWCCAPGFVGLALGDGHCEPASLTYTGNYASTVVQANTASPPTNWPGGTVPPGVSTSRAAQTSKGTAAQTTSSPAAGQTGSDTSSGAGSSSTSTTKPNAGATVEHNSPLVVAGIIFTSTLLAAVLL
ncbi:hypothetical protein F5882DRAFT_525370 [Hyaloscypha sp. PMI_1271]|nr:hypothetical protein F5882DRAFT_525370 [Hyaloscypha sp. PMI_1271]